MLTNHIFNICILKKNDLVLNNLQWLIYHETKPIAILTFQSIVFGDWVDRDPVIIFSLLIIFQDLEVPQELKNLYKTVWEISQKVVIQMAADRGIYIDQSQSLNLHIAEPNYGKLTSMHFYAWKMVSCLSPSLSLSLSLCSNTRCCTNKQA